jgi:hypothetical protein
MVLGPTGLESIIEKLFDLKIIDKSNYDYMRRLVWLVKEHGSGR